MNVRMTTAAALVLVSAASCQATPPEAPPPRPGAAAAPSAPTAVHGVATYLERVKMPPGASLHVELIDAASGRRISETVVKDVGGPPIPFTLSGPSAAPTSPRALRARLIGPDGQRWFETPAPVAVPSDGTPVELLMRRAVAGNDSPQPASGPIAHWECGELGVMSRFDRAPGQVRLDYNGHTLTLPLARSASGARYADARGSEFWTKGATGTLTLAGEPGRECVQAAQASPWNQAVLRGALFRAVGNEPGWSVEVGGNPVVLDAQLDYGERRLHEPVQPASDGFVGTGSASVRLRVERKACADGMSGQQFEATVTLQAGDRTYRGCGAYLQE